MTMLTPEEARERFGELTVAVGEHMRVHQEFETDEGIWHPVFDEAMGLRGYKLRRHPERRKGPAPYQPKGR